MGFETLLLTIGKYGLPILVPLLAFGFSFLLVKITANEKNIAEITGKTKISLTEKMEDLKATLHNSIVKLDSRVERHGIEIDELRTVKVDKQDHTKAIEKLQSMVEDLQRQNIEQNRQIRDLILGLKNDILNFYKESKK